MKIEDTERAVFKKLISNPALLAANIYKISPEDFISSLFRQVWGAFTENPSAVAHYTPTPSFYEILLRDRIHDKAELERAAVMLAGVAMRPADPKDLDMLIREVKANRMCREMANIIQRNVPAIKPESIEAAYETMLKDLMKLPLMGASSAIVAKIREVHEYLEERVMSYLDAAASKVQACLKAFDIVMGGFAYGEFVVLTAGTGMGKSNLLLWWAEQFVEKSLNVLYVTIEMSYHETLNRYHSIQTGYPVLDIAQKRISDVDMGDYFEKLIAATKSPEARPAFLKECSGIKNRKDPKFALKISKKYKNRAAKMFIIDIEACTPARIEQEVMRLQMDNKIDCVFVDFLNVMDPDFAHKDRVRELTSISRSMKKLARKTETVLFTAAQLDTTTLEGTQDEKISADRVKYARAISENADWLIAFHRTAEDIAMKQIRLQLAKHRHSADCEALIEFDFNTMQAVDLGFVPGTFIPDGYNQLGDKSNVISSSSWVSKEEKKELDIVDTTFSNIVPPTIDGELDILRKVFDVKKVTEIKAEAKELKAEIKAEAKTDVTPI